MKAKQKEPPASVLLDEHLTNIRGVPVLLKKAASQVTEDDGEIRLVIPDPEGLEVAVALARVTIFSALSGVEIKFLRQVLAIKAAALAELLGVTANAVSRWENEDQVISEKAERILRLRVLHALRDRVRGARTDAHQVLEIRPAADRQNTGALLAFERKMILIGGLHEEVWLCS